MIMEFYFFNQIRNKTQFVVCLPRVSAFHCTFLPPLPGWNVQNPNKATGCNLLGENLPLPNKHAAGRMLCPEFLLSLQRSPSFSRRQSWVLDTPPSGAAAAPPRPHRAARERQGAGARPSFPAHYKFSATGVAGRRVPTPPGFCSCGKAQVVCGEVGAPVPAAWATWGLTCAMLSPGSQHHGAARAGPRTLGLTWG